jgi:hypothetical protein
VGFAARERKLSFLKVGFVRGAPSELGLNDNLIEVSSDLKGASDCDWSLEGALDTVGGDAVPDEGYSGVGDFL